ncbi:Deleted in malignant brain tumors 1 protein [Orchesella cincta]|uniref:Deleted in malignant brain tumors 1 protein n=1 Tax=Orchesella cincta TaxID=48709 RepID=A0A1D2MNV8_ORCCI|nr:Deleted in malignant brain tumors 1 protein [Orchesella cincta]
MKDNDPSPRAINEIRHKVKSLEGSVSQMNGELEKLSLQNEELEQSMLEQKTLLETVAEGFVGMQNQFSAHGNRLSDLETMTTSTKNLFVSSNQTCGGELVAQSGTIIFYKQPSSEVKYPSSCVWTVRANNRGFIKVSTHPTYRASQTPYVISTFVVEILKTNGTGSSNSSQAVQTKITKLEKSMHHVFTGPIIFIVTSLASWNAIELHLQFEGIGKRVEKHTSFTHKTLLGESGNFSSSQWESSSNSGQSDDKLNYTLDYATIVISNFVTKAYLQAKMGNGGCSNGSSFIILSHVMENSTVVTDCCKKSCEGTNALINYGTPFIILISKNLKQSQALNFTLNWVADPIYPSNTRYGVGLASQCGGVLGGTSGTIMYKPHETYSENERCVFVIVSQPRPTSSIIIDVVRNGIEDPDDHLYMMELTDVNGEELSDAPRITNLEKHGMYEAQSREVYIVFYSDSSVSGNGFSLTWNSKGDFINTKDDVTTQFAILNSDNGSATNLLGSDIFTSGIHQVFVFTPVVSSAYHDGSHLHFNKTLGGGDENDCFNKDWSLFTAVDGLLTKTVAECDKLGEAEATLQNADGLAVLVRNSKNTDSEFAMDFKWTREFNEPVNTNVFVNDNKCGGVIIGSKGTLHYKAGENYNHNENCVWLLHSPTSSGITLKLVHNGFEECCDYLLVNTIDPATGTLRDDVVRINQANRTQTFKESIVVIVFHSDSSTLGTGFSLEFTTHGRNVNRKYSYKLLHTDEPDGTMSFPRSEWDYEDETTGKDEIYVFASSAALHEDTSDKYFTVVDWHGGVFNKANDSCAHDSLVIYSGDGSRLWQSRGRFPNENGTSCGNVATVPERKNLFRTHVSSFIGIYKPVEFVHQSDENETQTHFSFDYRKSHGCGGKLEGKFGEISYKEDEKYENNENCIWRIEVPETGNIFFNLEKSNFEECCDSVTVYSAYAAGTSGGPALKLTSNNRTAVVRGPRAYVRFASDKSVTGHGFRLRFHTLSDSVGDNNCGGVITAKKGVLEYKVGDEYRNNERCIYLLHPPNSTSITLDLIDNGFEVCCDYLLVSTIDPITGIIRDETVAITGANRTHTFEESLLIIVFISDGGTRGRGFSLQFSANGSNPNPEYSYKLVHLSDENGIIKYPSSIWGDRTSKSKEIFVLASSLNIQAGDNIFTTPTTMSWSSGVFQKSTESCEYSSITFYTSPGTDGWLTRAQFPNDNDTSECTDVITVAPKRNVWNTVYSAFIAIYKPISSEQNVDDSARFRFTYEKDFELWNRFWLWRCRHSGTRGEISYKEGVSYNNNEKCIFLVEVPQAETIIFELERSGFEDCCDYVTVSSVRAFTGVGNQTAVLKSSNKRATVNGPVVIVTFFSDNSVTGNGFRLGFSASTRASRDHSHSYHLVHHSMPHYNEFSHQVGPNQVVVFAYSPSREVTGSSQVNITSFRPQVNELCQSDTVLVYDVHHSENEPLALRKSFSASDADAFRNETLAASNCTEVDDDAFLPCENMEECQDAPIGSSFRLHSTPFVVVYSSVDITGNLELRGFALVSNTNNSDTIEHYDVINTSIRPSFSHHLHIHTPS